MLDIRQAQYTHVSNPDIWKEKKSQDNGRKAREAKKRTQMKEDMEL